MLSPEALKKRALEAAERIRLEKAAEEERRRKEIEAQQKEAELLHQQEVERKRRERAVSQSLANCMKLAIKAAARGERSTSTELPEFIANELTQRVEDIGMRYKLKSTSTSTRKLAGTLYKLIDKLSVCSDGELFKNRLLEVQKNLGREHIQYICSDIEDVIDDLNREKPVGELGKVLAYAKLNVKPLFNTLTSDEILQEIEIFWRPKELHEFVLNQQHDVPSWLLSTSGSGLMQSLGECCAKDSDAGNLQSEFRLEVLPINSLRWGENTMTKLTHLGKPIGVTPFDMKVFPQILGILGFKTEVKTEGEFRSLVVRW